MKKQDLDFIKSKLKSNNILNDYLTIIKTDNHTCKIVFKDKVITLFEMAGFAYLTSWYCEGCISATQAKNMLMLVNEYNDRF